MLGTLRDAVHAAGARRAITSLWQVEDAARHLAATVDEMAIQDDLADTRKAVQAVEQRLRNSPLADTGVLLADLRAKRRRLSTLQRAREAHVARRAGQ